MQQKSKYYVLRGRSVPDVMLKVVEAKHLIETGREPSVAAAVDRMGLSRSSFYKYKDDIFEFHDSAEGTTINLTAQMDDEPGRLSEVLRQIADCGANILTIHQSLPIAGIATISLSIRVLPTTGDIGDLMDELRAIHGVHHVRLVAGE
ncbi:MAG: ACT domain-containing protein [Lachnospiraceae bacterium]|nr:ACT domain-containing protein [Lachnospiraceae bacterium]